MGAQKGLIAVDTNIVVRFLVSDDHPGQTKAATRLFTEHQIVLSPTVLLETEWVLRGRFRFAAGQVGNALLHLLAIPTVHCLFKDAMVKAIHALQNGCDFADAIHTSITGAPEVEAFVTFDRVFARRAAALDLPPVKLLARTVN